MTVNRGSPSRRNSFAVANKSQAHPGRKRRAHSIAPGDHLSPAAKARRSLAPRKSILKAAAYAPDDGDDATQSMEITRDYREVNDNLTRKSLGRRVSFANHAHVRLFEVPDQNTNSTASPQSSPAVESELDSPRATNDENAYPGASRLRRRSSTRRSLAFSEGGGEESMDMDSDDTGFSPSAFLGVGNEGLMDEIFDDMEGIPDDLDGDDMDVTEVIPRNIVRKRSLSFGGPRQPLANLTIPQSVAETHDDQQDPANENSFVEEDSTQSQSFTSEGDVSQPMEFTVPLIRPPEPPSEAWLALRSATHSGNTPYVPPPDENDEEDAVEEMELTDAVSRLQAARASLGLDGADGEVGLDSFTGSEDSFMDEDAGNGEDGNQTVNVTQLMKRVSIGPSADSTMVLSSQEQTREEVINNPIPDPPIESPGIYPAIPESPPAAPSIAAPQTLYPEVPSEDDNVPPTVSPAEPPPQPLPDRPPVFSAPQTQPSISEPPRQSALFPKPLAFSFAPKPPTPSSPVRSRLPSPSRPRVSPTKFSAAFAPPVVRPSPKKRLNDATDTPEAPPNPAKRLAATGRLSLTPGRGTGAVRVLLSPATLSPLRMAAVQAGGLGEQPALGAGKRPSLGFRRPSGYFAQRKSLGVNAGAPTPDTTSPTKKAMSSLARKSIGSSVDSDDRSWLRRSRSPEKTTDPNQRLENTQGPSSLAVRDSPVSRNLAPTPSRASRSPLRNSIVPTPDEQDLADVQNTLPQDDDNPAEQWRDQVEDADLEDDQGPQISIEQFFEMTGIRFMDDIAAPRRSIVPPSVLRPSRRASTEAQIPLSEYAVAMAVNVPQLELYTHVGKDLQTWIERIKEIYKEAEEEAQKSTPPLFQEFVTTDESGQAELLHQLKLIKVHNHAQAKSEWYDWKMQWVEQLSKKAEEGFKNLEADAKVLEGVMRQAQDMVPSLQQEFDELMAELEKEKAEIAELEGSDPNYLNELKATIAEQNAELDAFKADVEEANAKLDRLQEKLDEVESQKKEVTSIIENAERRIYVQKNSTRTEVFQLKDELEALQNLHMWRATKIYPESFEFTYASSYCVSIPCIKFRPIVADIQIRRAEHAKTKYKEAFPVLSALILGTAKQLVSRPEDQAIRQIVQRLGDYWSSCTQLQTQLKLVAIKYPVSIQETPSGFSATTTILFPSVKAKALISFSFDTPVYSSWPMLIQATRCDVRVAYGPIDRDTIQKAVSARLQQATPANNHACLLDTCMEAADCYV